MKRSERNALMMGVELHEKEPLGAILRGIDPRYNFPPVTTWGAFSSTKTYDHTIGLSCCFRQWRAKSHCRLMHGYALKVKLGFSCEELDENNWCMDFGGLKPVKAWLEETFDHKTVVAKDDPQISIFREMQIAGLCELTEVPSTGMEAFAHLIFMHVNIWLLRSYPDHKVGLDYIEVSEHGGNSALYRHKGVMSYD